jgi:cytochrome c-type biogenesis protein CcmH
MRHGLLLALALLAAGVGPCLADDVPPPPAGAGQPRSLSPQDMLKGTRDQMEALATHLTRDGGSAEEWLLLARSYLQFQEFAKARDAATHAVAARPKDVEPRLVLAEAQMGGVSHAARLPVDFVATMREILDMAPDNPSALYYVGMAESEAGHPERTRQLWGHLLEVLPKDDPRRDDLARRLSALP